MKGFAITSKGLEEAASIEIKEIICSKTEEKECCVFFHPKKIEDFCLLCYKSQSTSRILFLVDYFNFWDNFFGLLEEKIKKLNFSGIITNNNSFAVKCERHGSHDFTSMDVEKNSSEYIINNIGKINVDLQHPDIIFYVYIINNACYLGIDLCGFDLSKRDYRIFTRASSLKGTIAYSLLRFCGYKKEDVLLDPFSDSGEITIEAALFSSGISANRYKKERFAFLRLGMFRKIDFENFFKDAEKINDYHKKPKISSFSGLLSSLSASQKNAKIAGINKYINFSKISVDWLDTKLDKHQTDKIVTKLPSYSKKISLSEADKVYNEFFYQAEYALNDKGQIGVLLRNRISEEIPLKYGFKLLKEKEIFSGKQMYFVFVFSKN